MSSCISGGGRTYALDLEIIKSPSTSTTRTSHTSSSPSSTLSESSNSPLAISTRKARTPRKRPKQTYNEAAALLSTVYPNIFSTKNSIPTKFTKTTHHHHHSNYFDESSELLLPFRVIDDSGFLLHHQPIQDKPRLKIIDKLPCQSSGEIDSQGNCVENSMELCSGGEFNEDDDFDAESILDEEIEEGIDSIMGNLSVNNNDSNSSCPTTIEQINHSYWYGNPMGIGFGGKLDQYHQFGYGMRRGVRALRHVDEGNWWCFPTVNVLQISPKTTTSTTTTTTTTTTRNKKVSTDNKKKKKVTDKEKSGVVVESKTVVESPKENSIPKPTELLLKLKYDDVLNAWSDRCSPFLDESLSSDGNDVSARLAQIDLFSESGVREASVMRYKEKRRTRLFSKKIRYQVRKVNADRRPRMKGRFVRRPNSSNAQDEKGRKKVMLCDL